MVTVPPIVYNVHWHLCAVAEANSNLLLSCFFFSRRKVKIACKIRSEHALVKDLSVQNGSSMRMSSTDPLSTCECESVNTQSCSATYTVFILILSELACNKYLSKQSSTLKFAWFIVPVNTPSPS